MRWKGRRASENVEDRRGGGLGRVAIGGGGAIVVVVLALLFGVDPSAIFQQLGETGPSGDVAAPANPAEEELKEFVSVVLAETESVWREEFRRRGRTYEEPTLVLFTNRVESACGSASAASGPFYCPGDRRLYIDLGFYETLRERLGAPGDFAQAYVVAHEVGHHVQNLLGISDRVHEERSRLSEAEFNRLSVRMELQADFLAGVWAHHTQRNDQLLEEGDVEEALAAASAIGDDRLQMESRGTIVPDSFTHGTSEQRMRWFMLGYRTGDLERGDTFAAGAL